MKKKDRTQEILEQYGIKPCPPVDEKLQETVNDIIARYGHLIPEKNQELITKPLPVVPEQPLSLRQSAEKMLSEMPTTSEPEDYQHALYQLCDRELSLVSNTESDDYINQLNALCDSVSDVLDPYTEEEPQPPTDECTRKLDALYDSYRSTEPPQFVATGRFHDGHQLTDEQCRAIDLATSRRSLKIEAFAGAGKTSTLSAISAAMPERKGLYIAFNRAIADEAAQKFPSNVECRTAHSLAYRAVGYHFKDRFQRLAGGYLATEHLGITSYQYDLSPAAWGNLTLDTINRFCQSASPEITTDHAPWSALKVIEDVAAKRAIAEEVVGYARKTWDLMIDPNGQMPVTHDVYLKLWAMGNPVINRDFILFDEAQDASPVMLDIVCRQQAQQIYVGDRYQQIYSWRGAINAMQTIDTAHTCSITQSFRFGQPIADLANKILNNNLSAGVNIHGFNRISSRIGFDPQPDAILCRTNSSLINTLINRLDNGERIAVTGGTSEIVSLLRAAQELIDTGKTGHHELMLFQSWEEVEEFSETDSGASLSVLVKLMDRHNPAQLISKLERVSRVREDDADLILSTAHKSKGREWASVRLENDFRHPESNGYSAEETNLLYVAATRAQNNLDVSECEAVSRSLDKSIKSIDGTFVAFDDEFY